MNAFRILTALLALAAAPTAAGAGDRDVRQLLDGVESLAPTGVPGRLCVYGDDASALVLGDVGGGLRAPLAAAGTAGAARLVAFAHNGYFGPVLDQGDGWRLMENSLRWASRKSRGRIRVGVLDAGPFADALGTRGYDVEVVDRMARLDATPAIDVLCGGVPGWTDGDVAIVEKFVKGGGGLVLGVTGWGWQQLNPGKDLLRDNAGNRIAQRFGIVWIDGTVGAGKDGLFRIENEPLAWCQAASALQALTAKQAPTGFGAAQAEQASWTVAQAARWVPEDDRAFRPRLGKAFSNRPPIVVGPLAPLKSDRPLDRLQLSMEIDDGLRAPAHKVRAHPSAEGFPGAVPANAPRVIRSVNVELSVPRWHSTGLYAAPGETIEITLPAAATTKGLRVRIGAHKDDIAHHGEWKRAPRITREEPLDAETVKIASPFGGLLYLVAPDAAPPETVSVKLRNVVEAPRFVLGETAPAEWRGRIRDLPAPWAELATRGMILTVPSTTARTIEDPTEVLQKWVVAMDAAADLAGIPAQRPAPERFVCDVQISAGYMHSGYPIMAHLDAAAFVSDPVQLCEHGWGPFHEVGHNHQEGAWTFHGSVEVTCNVFTLYMLEQVCGKTPIDDPRFAAQARTRRWREQRDARDAFDKWKSDPFLALLVYVDLQQEFGWEAYKKVFREYRALARNELPANDDKERDEWLVRMSRAVGRNLGPLFASWGLDTSAEARGSLADLPVWLPEGRL